MNMQRVEQYFVSCMSLQTCKTIISSLLPCIPVRLNSPLKQEEKFLHIKHLEISTNAQLFISDISKILIIPVVSTSNYNISSSFF